MPSKDTTPLSLYGNDREYLREQERTNELLADIAGETYESPGNIPNGKYIIQKRMLDAAQKKNELLESIAGGGGTGGGGAAKGIDINYGTDVISLKNKDGATIEGSGATLPAYGVSFDPTTGGLTLTKNGTAVQGQTVTIPNYGSPVGVTDSADMVDEGTIYLYEGTTGGGYTNGHFYWWDGSAWADGGEYAAATVQTDKTLLVEDRAADAKATGEAVGELKTHVIHLESAIDPLEEYGTVNISNWVNNKYVAASTGAEIELNNARCAAIECLPGTSIKINLNNGHSGTPSFFANENKVTLKTIIGSNDDFTADYTDIAPDGTKYIIINGWVGINPYLAIKTTDYFAENTEIAIKRTVNLAREEFTESERWEQGSISSANGNNLDGITTLIRTKNISYYSDITVLFGDNYRFRVFEYTSKNIWVSTSDWYYKSIVLKPGYYRFLFGKNPAATTDLTALNDLEINGVIPQKLKNLATLEFLSYKLNWEIGSIFASNGADYDENMHCIRTPNTNKIYCDSDTLFLTKDTTATGVYAFKYSADGTFVERIGESNQKMVAVSQGYYRFIVLYASNLVITDETLNDYAELTALYGKDIGLILNELNNYTNPFNGYSIGADGIRTKLHTIKKSGAISGNQAFLVYDGYFYSTNGTTIYKQDGDLTAVDSASISTGHANNFQLGNDNIGYISGWNDNKIYCIDLDTLTLVDTITLPTTGYTTGVVDDLNKIIYIFQRDTQPNTQTNYNFIVYDYDNDTIISSRKVNKFGAMQAADLLDGRIIVAYGTGTEQLPTGISVYNTNGDIITEYKLDVIESIEPEGVFVDRTTKRLIFSTIQQNIYTVTN